ncbi:MAG TPA: hypothetical protein PKL08_00785 [Thermoanaerobaculaceae bacterium]|nr:hypothetical protein [Thermoanaerobaculaceae bacterium]
MPILYPPTAPTLSGDVLTVNRFLNSPMMVQRRLRTIADQRFVSPVLLTGSIEASGGAVAYEQSESIYTDRSPSAVAPGGEYELALATGGVAALANVTKYGQDVRITDEAIGRQRMAAAERAMVKAVNQAVAFVDTLSLAAIAAAVTQTQAAAFAWNNASADPFLDVMLADAVVSDLAQGYDTDTLVLTVTLYSRLVANQKVIAGLAREGSNVVTESGEVKMIAGKVLRPVPAARMPAGVGAMLIDSTALGALAYENIPSPEYQGAANETQSWIRRDPAATDSWLLRVRRAVVPIVQEPSCGVKITGV